MKVIPGFFFFLTALSALPATLPRIDQAMQEMIDKDEIAGAVTVVAAKGKICICRRMVWPT